MPLTFRTWDGHPTVGLELELQLVDAGTGGLRPVVDEVMEAIRHHHPQQAKHIHRELFTNTLELVTGVARTVDEAVADLDRSITIVRETIAEHGIGVRLMSAGSHPFEHWRDQQITADDRLIGLVQDMQLPVRRLLTFGTHIHVCVPDGEAAIRTVGLMNRHLPLFIALSASSPYWNAADTGLASYRALVFEALPLTGLPPDVRTWEEYVQAYDAFVRAGWAKAHKDLHWDVRPSPQFGTVELRVCDAVPTLVEAAAVCALAQCLTVAGERAAVIPELPRHVLSLNKWQAHRFDLSGQIMVTPEGQTASVRDTVSALVERLESTAVELGCVAALARVHEVLGCGASSTRQRRVFAATHAADTGGVDLRLRAVVEALCNELERGHPQRLVPIDEPVPPVALAGGVQSVDIGTAGEGITVVAGPRS